MTAQSAARGRANGAEDQSERETTPSRNETRWAATRTGSAGTASLGSQTGSREHGTWPATNEKGSASIYLTCACVAIWTLAVALSAVAGAVVARHRAAAAADMGALAAAQRMGSSGSAGACRAAAVVVSAHRARLVVCRIDGDTAYVVAEIAVGVGALDLPPARAQARAGAAA